MGFRLRELKLPENGKSMRSDGDHATRADHGLCCKQVEREVDVAARSLEARESWSAC